MYFVEGGVGEWCRALDMNPEIPSSIPALTTCWRPCPALNSKLVHVLYLKRMKGYVRNRESYLGRASILTTKSPVFDVTLVTSVLFCYYFSLSVNLVPMPFLRRGEGGQKPWKRG